VKIELPRYQCLRCNHRWIPRSDRLPKRCPNCGTQFWQTYPHKEHISTEIEN